MSLKLYPSSFVAGVLTQVFAYDFDHDNDDLSQFDKAELCFTPAGGTPISWPVDHIEYVYSYGCPPNDEPGQIGKAVGLLIFATPVAPPQGCLSSIFGLFGLVHGVLRAFGRVGSLIGTGDLSGSTSSGNTTVGFDNTMVTVAG